MNKWIALLIVSMSMSGCYLTEEIPKDQDVWSIGLPTDHGMDQNTLLITNQNVLNGQYENIESVTIIKDDHLIFENYFGANRRTQVKPIDRVTLLFSQLAIGMAIDEGLIDSLNTQIWELLPTYEAIFQASTYKKEITIKQLLTHRSGLSWNEGVIPIESENSDIQLMKQEADWVSYALGKPLEAIPGTRYSIDTGTGIILAKIIENVSGEKLDRFLQSRLFEPLYIDDPLWEYDPIGTPNGADGLSISNIDLTKVAYMLLKDGIWNGKEIISFNWMIESSSLQNLVSGEYGLGYYWWRLNDDFASTYSNLSINDTFFLFGNTGIAVYIIPHQDMLITVYANNSFYGFYNPTLYLYFYIISAVR